MIKAVIFDYGGVIAPEQGGGWVSYFAKLVDLPVDQARKVWAQAYPGLNTAEIDEDKFWKKVEKVIGYKLPDNKNNIWTDGLVGQPWPEMLEFAKELNKQGIRTAILSNTISPKLIDNRLAEAYHGFDPVILSHEVGMAKPDPVFYQLALDKLVLEPSECVFVDNIPEELAPAEKLGMKVVLANSMPEETISKIKNILSKTPTGFD